MLAAAIGISPESISFEYCRNVLQKRWGITCRHGEQHPAEPAVPAAERWQEVGKVDAVKAVLISEGSGSSGSS